MQWTRRVQVKRQTYLIHVELKKAYKSYICYPCIKEKKKMSCWYLPSAWLLGTSNWGTGTRHKAFLQTTNSLPLTDQEHPLLGSPLWAAWAGGETRQPGQVGLIHTPPSWCLAGSLCSNHCHGPEPGTCCGKERLVIQWWSFLSVALVGCVDLSQVLLLFLSFVSHIIALCSFHSL